jgi:hypothetical protein
MKKLCVIIVCWALSLSLAYSAPKATPELVTQLTPKLNSDRISLIFGSYGIDQMCISSAFPGARISNLYSLEDSQKVMRTLAIVHFIQPTDERLKAVHAKISQGESIGIALKNDGWSIEKKPLYFGTIALSPQLQAWMNEKEKHSAAIHIYQLNVFKKPQESPLHYCSIIEIHSPQYLDEEWLQLLYPEQYPDCCEQTSHITSLLQSVEMLIKQFPYPEKESL